MQAKALEEDTFHPSENILGGHEVGQIGIVAWEAPQGPDGEAWKATLIPWVYTLSG